MLIRPTILMAESLFARPPARTEIESATTARVALAAGRFALAPVFEHIPDAQVSLEPTVANPDTHGLVLVKAECDRRVLDTAPRADPAIATTEEFSAREDARQYRVTLDGRARQLIEELVAEGITLLAAHGRAGQWKLRLLSSNPEGIARAHEVLEYLGCEPDLEAISSFNSEQQGRDWLTDEQDEALVAAFEMGYYNIPRSVTSGELANQLDISHQAFSERFRRAYRQLKSATVVAIRYSHHISKTESVLNVEDDENNFQVQAKGSYPWVVKDKCLSATADRH